MSTLPSYKVTFGRVARTLVYEDAVGTVAFTFDVGASEDPSKETWMVHLEHGGTTPDGKTSIVNSALPHDWVVAARDRVKQYLLGIGYQVKDHRARPSG